MFRILAGLMMILLLTVSPTVAQEPSISASIVAGTCDATGDTVADLRALDPEGRSFLNMNTPQDYARALRLWDRLKG